jgi:CheY-like chemotaxis protein
MGTILIVDDNERLRATLDRALSQAGYLTMTAADGGVALRMLMDVEVDLVITDIYMPEMDGIELLSRILDRMPHAKVIAMTAGGSLVREELLDDARMLGAVRVISKPFTTDELMEVVRESLGDAD